MSFLGIEFNDTALAGVGGDKLVFAEPGCACLNAAGVVFGSAAKNAARTRPAAFQDRYWLDLSEASLAGCCSERSLSSLVSAADLEERQRLLLEGW